MEEDLVSKFWLVSELDDNEDGGRKPKLSCQRLPFVVIKAN